MHAGDVDLLPGPGARDAIGDQVAVKA
jgi:hypothetical protein